MYVLALKYRVGCKVELMTLLKLIVSARIIDPLKVIALLVVVQSEFVLGRYQAQIQASCYHWKFSEENFLDITMSDLGIKFKSTCSSFAQIFFRRGKWTCPTKTISNWNSDSDYTPNLQNTDKSQKHFVNPLFRNEQL